MLVEEIVDTEPDLGLPQERRPFQRVIERQVRDGLAKILVASVGPATSEALEEYGVRVDFEPSHPKMGFLVQETASRLAALSSVVTSSRGPLRARSASPRRYRA